MARIFLERRDLGEEARRLFELIGDDARGEVAGECSPPLDVIETESTVEICVDLPGVRHEDIQVLFSRGTLVIGGVKQPPACEQQHEAAFHLAERGFGRFARAIRLTGAFDSGRATATLASGELRIVLPRIEERRGRELRIPVTAQ